MLCFEQNCGKNCQQQTISKLNTTLCSLNILRRIKGIFDDVLTANTNTLAVKMNCFTDIHSIEFTVYSACIR